jgi:hypothetical protein
MSAVSVDTTATLPARAARSRRFYVAMALAMIAAVIAGFAPSLVDTSARRAPLTPLVTLHGLLFGLWMLTFLLQASLIARRHVAAHRKVGAVACGLAVLIVIVGYVTARGMVRRGFDLSGDLNAQADPALQVVFALGDLVTFTVLTTAGVIYRRRSDVHKRLMLLGTIGGMMPASFAHLIGHFPALHTRAPIILVPLCVFFFAPAIYDRLVMRRFHPVTIWGGVALFVWANLRAAVIGPSAAWHHLIAWWAQ